MKKLFLQTGSASDVGSIREINEDRVLLKKSLCRYGEYGIFVIADGVGGLGNGDMASELAVNMASSFWNKYTLILDSFPLKKMVKSLKNLFEQINKAVLDCYIEMGSRIGTTLTVLYIYKNWYLVLHVGDTRLYLLRNRKLVALTKDQTSPLKKNILINCIGRSEHLDISIKHGKIKSEDIFMLCSDGFYNCIPEDDMLSILSAPSDSMQKTIQGLSSLLRDNASDNLSAVLIQCNYR